MKLIKKLLQKFKSNQNHKVEFDLSNLNIYLDNKRSILDEYVHLFTTIDDFKNAYSYDKEFESYKIHPYKIELISFEETFNKTLTEYILSLTCSIKTKFNTHVLFTNVYVNSNNKNLISIERNKKLNDLV